MQPYKLNDQVRNGFLTYQRVEELLKNSSTPLTRRQIYESASVRDVTPKEHTIGDVIKAFTRDKVIRRVPYFGSGQARYAYEWVTAKSHAQPAPTSYKETVAHVIDMVNNPPHYTVGGIETIDFIQAKLSKEEYKGFLKGTILAYASRLGHKDGTDDAGKIGWYAKKLGELNHA